MTLDSLLWLIREQRFILISPDELWPDPRIDGTIQRAIKRHQRGLGLLIEWSDIAACPSPDLHRKFWYHAGGQQYRCAACEQLEGA